MISMLDTDICIDTIKRKPISVLKRLESLQPGMVVVATFPKQGHCGNGSYKIMDVPNFSINNKDPKMETYTIFKKGETVQHCLNIPAEFVDQELEITIRPARKVGDVKKRIMLLFEKNKDINPF